MQKRAIFSRDFLLVAAGQIISIFGNQILRYALPLSLLQQTGSSALFGTMMAFSVVPMILLFPVGGMLADRANKRNIMVVLDFGTAALIALFYALLGTWDIVPLMTLTLMLLYGIQGAYQPAVKASVPVLVAPAHLMKANAVVDVINSVASVAGPVAGGLLFSALGLRPILIVSAVCFFASAVMELFIRIPFEKSAAVGGMLATALADLKASFHFLRKTQPLLWQVSLIFSASNLLLTSLILIALPVLMTQHLGFAPDTANRLYGYAQGILAGGAVLGGLLAGIFSGRLTVKTSPLLLGGCALPVLVCGLVLHAVRAPMALYLTLTFGSSLLLALHTLFQIQMTSCLQLRTPQALVGKVMSCFIGVVMCTNPLGQLLYGFIFEHIGKRVYLPFYGAALLMLALSVATRRTFHALAR